jgi:hypothetical protein
MISIRFAVSSVLKVVTPVILPPGCVIRSPCRRTAMCGVVYASLYVGQEEKGVVAGVSWAALRYGSQRGLTGPSPLTGGRQVVARSRPA